MSSAKFLSCIRRSPFLPNHLCHKIFFSKNFIAQSSKICYFIVIYRNKNNPIIPQEIRCQPQAGIHHVQPVGVIPAHRFRVALGGLGGHFHVPGQWVGKVVLIHEVIARVVGRVYVDHLHLAEIGFLQQLQNLQVIALNIEVLRRVPIHAVPRYGPQGGGTAFLCQPQTVAFALPLELVLLEIVCDVLTAQGEQFVNVQPPLGEALREYGAELVLVGGLKVHGETV